MHATLNIYRILTCHGQLRQTPWTWVKRWHHDLVSTRVTELRSQRSRTVWLVMRHRTNWCQSPCTWPAETHNSLRRRNICTEAPTPNSVTSIVLTTSFNGQQLRILSAEYLTGFCAFRTEIFPLNISRVVFLTKVQRALGAGTGVRRNVIIIMSFFYYRTFI